MKEIIEEIKIDFNEQKEREAKETEMATEYEKVKEKDGSNKKSNPNKEKEKEKEKEIDRMEKKQGGEGVGEVVGVGLIEGGGRKIDGSELIESNSKTSEHSTIETGIINLNQSSNSININDGITSKKIE